MKKVQKPSPGRPPMLNEAMKQIAIRLPHEMLDQIEEIVGERFGQPDRTAVIRELLASALEARRKRR
ncbi:MAG TPA: hypothetical protein VHE81_06660 [Lacipirellulaceae bacterium]|jgi:metal-responsive CopG/Arc/MetJ family transcriptional regulator|nr:hypothetical protein [Lacipirellulaceae bacterium]